MSEASRNGGGKWSDATLPAGTSTTSDERSYLVVLEGDDVRTVRLPEIGEVIIGRGETAHVRLGDPSVSRNHAQLSITPAETDITDLGGQNGTLVNGEKLRSPRALLSGDEIALGGATLIFHAGPPQRAPRLVPSSHLYRRLTDELERAARHRRGCSTIALRFGAGTDRAAMSELLERSVRNVDVAAWDGDDALLVLLTESGAAAAREAARRFLELVLPLRPNARAGIATFPHDGSDADMLILKARRSARAAKPRTVNGKVESEETPRLGGRRLVVDDPTMKRLFGLLGRLAPGDLPVLLLGETGTGKDVAASALHEWSKRRGPFVAINCAAVPENLIESELFGYERGAFTGAHAEKPGLIATANGGTLFLDEIAELPQPAQAKLLRVLETKQLLPLGAVRAVPIDVRVVSATNRDPDAEIAAERFRRDLYFRLRGASLWLPPLRDRRSEIIPLAQLFLEEACARSGRAQLQLSQGAMTALRRHPWPGNVRELQSVMEYAASIIPETTLEAEDAVEILAQGRPHAPLRGELTTDGGDGADSDPKSFRPIEDELRELEARRMEGALIATLGNRTRAAELIGMPRRTFMAKLRQYGLNDAGKVRRDDEPG